MRNLRRLANRITLAWTCTGCGGSNADTASKCAGCGASW